MPPERGASSGRRDARRCLPRKGLATPPSSSGSAVTPVRGRARECALLDGLIAAIRESESRALMLRGEGGRGKAALLDSRVGSASDATVVRGGGVESEMELAFASLHQL